MKISTYIGQYSIFDFLHISVNIRLHISVNILNFNIDRYMFTYSGKYSVKSETALKSDQDSVSHYDVPDRIDKSRSGDSYSYQRKDSYKYHADESQQFWFNFYLLPVI